MFFNVTVSMVLTYLICNSIYSSLYNCLIITISSLLKIIFHDNYIVHKILELATLNSIFFYTIDTIHILRNGKITIFIIHHICSCQLLLSKYIFDYDIYISYIFLFIIELSSVIYNLYHHRFINKNIHIFFYVTLRLVSNILLIYFILYENKYTYYLELILDLISYILLFAFNTGGILKSLKCI